MLPHIRKVVEELDMESEPVLKTEVIYIRHGEATKVVEVVNQIVNGQRQNRDKDKKNTTNLNARAEEAAAAPVPAPVDGAPAAPQIAAPAGYSSSERAAAADSSSTSGIEFSEYVQVVSEERSNSIVVYGTAQDLRQIMDIIDKLDIVLLQVKIDVIITEVVLSQDQVSGLSSFGFSFTKVGSSEAGAGFSGSTQTYSLTDSSQPAFAVNASEDGFSMIFDLARQNQDIKVLSAPTIVTTHNKKAEVNISQSLPIITSSMADLSSISTTRSQVDYRDIGIKLIVTPLVGKNGQIQLEIDQSVDSISGYTTIDNNQQPIISKRKATSFVSARSDEVIVLAGLQQVDTAQMEGGVWLLSDIPLVGELFKPSKNESKRRELIIFIRPTVVESSQIDDAITSETIGGSTVRTEIENQLLHGKFYPNRELQDRASAFERDRFYNKMLNDPAKLINGKTRGPGGEWAPLELPKEAGVIMEENVEVIDTDSSYTEQATLKKRRPIRRKFK